MTVWRVGHHTAPLDFTPYEFYGWENRFDDPWQEFRTVYAAEERITAVREVLQDFRVNTKVRAELVAFGASAAEFEPSRSVPWRWRTERVLAPATIDGDGDIVDLADPVVRARLEHDHAPILAQHSMPFLDISQVTSKTRIVTQTISRALYEDGAAGIRFLSNTDGKPCVVLFEGRGELVVAGPPEPLSTAVPELLTVCSEWGLILREHDLPASVVAPPARRRLPAWLARLFP